MDSARTNPGGQGRAFLQLSPARRLVGTWGQNKKKQDDKESDTGSVRTRRPLRAAL